MIKKYVMKVKIKKSKTMERVRKKLGGKRRKKYIYLMQKRN